MADNSSMKNVSQVEQFGKNISQVNQQMLAIFQKLRQQTQSVACVWDDDQFKHFSHDFDHDILKNVQEISVKMEIFAKYVEEMVKIHRMAQSARYY